MLRIHNMWFFLFFDSKHTKDTILVTAAYLSVCVNVYCTHRTRMTHTRSHECEWFGYIFPYFFFIYDSFFFRSLKKINKEFILLKNKQYIARHLKIRFRRYNNMVSMDMSLQRARDACVNEHSTFYEICIPINIDWRNIDDDTVNAYIYTILLPNESATLQSIHPDKICFNQWQMRSCFFLLFFKHFRFIYAFWMF